MELIGYRKADGNLDAVFAALSDPTRRAILVRLAQGEATVNELAEPFKISQPAISKHLKVLERSGLIERGINRTQRPARLKAGPMAEAVAWLEEFRKFWSGSFDQLDTLLEDLQQVQDNTKGEGTKT
ncbi:ArsR/SmtB family transcription factor [Roseibium sediminis]|uniref:ArsR/SmtB family transcription factor n=1 Tax=Roseibium sediminis TaxID=1775174 RepID=UPI00123D9881|nr:metalloregulator ArsR/SmtB family transcription factor [Roseibium sediminis]